MTRKSFRPRSWQHSPMLPCAARPGKLRAGLQRDLTETRGKSPRPLGRGSSNRTKPDPQLALHIAGWTC